MEFAAQIGSCTWTKTALAMMVFVVLAEIASA